MRTFALAAMMLACTAGAAHATGEAALPEDAAASTKPKEASAIEPGAIEADAPGAAAQEAATQAAPLAGVSAEERVIPDPWEKFNRSMYAVNDVLDRFILAPAAIAYAVVTPKPLRRGIANALDNANSPVVIANDVLQLKFKRAGVAFARLAVNSTVGLGGFLDVGSRIGLKEHTEDFGQTLGHWGVSTGPYVFLPLLGPTTVRDGVGAGVDVVMTPFAWTEFGGFKVLRWSRAGLTALDARAEALRPLAELRRTSADPYVTIRTFYALARKSAITDGSEDAGDLPEFADPLDVEGEAPEGNEEAIPQEEANPVPEPEEVPSPTGADVGPGSPGAPINAPTFLPVEAELDQLY